MSRTRAQEERAALQQQENLRRARLAALERDHFERTRHSLLLGGHELGHVKATAETEARLRPDPIARLVANETLTAEQGRAAVEIRMIFERISAALLARAGNLELRGPRGSSSVAERVALLHARRYLPWARYLAGQPAEEPPRAGAWSRLGMKPSKSGRCAEALEIAIEVVIDQRSLGQCDAGRHWRNGTAGKLLAYALAVYADIAGWERGGAAIAAFEAWWVKRQARKPRPASAQPGDRADAAAAKSP
ncbi:MAG TPA: hypothetical protein VN668_12820 [Stellaceae bacterium]|nr:hypothetical protein [Stellaceae bacterium]